MESIMRKIWNRLFNRYSAWELIDSNVSYIEVTESIYFAPQKRTVYFDKYKRVNLYTGLPQYKRIERA